MPRSYQAYPQNAVVTHSPANVGTGDPSSAINAGASTFKVPSLLDACNGVTSGTQNPFMAGLNTMGTGSASGVAGQTGNMLSGLQLFADSLCGFALGGTSAGEVLEAARQLRAQGGDLKATIAAVRQLRDTVGLGTTPQSVLAGVEAITGLVNTNPVARSTIATGQAAAGISGNQIIDALNGGQTVADQSHQLLTGTSTTGVSTTDLLNASTTALGVNTANHVGHVALSPASAINLTNQNLLTSDNFSTASTVAAEAHWSWDGTDGDTAADGGILGCAKCICDGQQDPLVSNEVLVVTGETIEVSVMVKWAALVYTGSSPIILAVEKYRKSNAPAGGVTYLDVGFYNVATIASPGANSSSYTGVDSSGYVGISGTYVVEPGVDQLRFRFQCLDTITAGTVKWDNASFLKTDLIADDCVPGVGTTVDDIVTQLYGVAGDGFTHNQSAVALGNTATSIVSVTARIAALEAEGHTGAIAGDDFSWTGTILSNANWGGSYTSIDGFGDPNGWYAADSTDATWTAGGTIFGTLGAHQTANFTWQGTDAVSTTDYQLIQLLLDSPPMDDLGYHAYIRLRGRISSSSYVMAAIGSDGTYVVGYQSGGTWIQLAAGSCSVPGLGSNINFYLGDKTNSLPRHFRLEVGTQVLADFNEVGTGSPLGSGNRNWGWGAEAFGDGGLAQASPPKVNQWLALDQ